ncbi:MAG: hypothetical protein LBU51_00390 [Bacteroidales bacterium]|nr:hypothetical protein [Bacteroidales bacterium]
MKKKNNILIYICCFISICHNSIAQDTHNLYAKFTNDKAIWETAIDDNGGLYLIYGEGLDSIKNDIHQLVAAWNSNCSIQIVLKDTCKDVVFVYVANEESLTQSLGSEGAERIIAGLVYTLTEHPQFEYVDLDFQERDIEGGDIAVPCRTHRIFFTDDFFILNFNYRTISDPPRKMVESFYNAIIHHQINDVSNYIKMHNFPVNYELSDKSTPLDVAIWAKNIEMVKILIDNGAKINSESCIEKLICTGEYEHRYETETKVLNILEYLLSKGLNTKFVFYAANYGLYDVFRRLLLSGATIVDKDETHRGKLRFFLNAVEKKDYEVLDKIKPIDDVMNGCDCYLGGTALVKAVRSNDIKMVRYLLNRGADKNAPEIDVCGDDDTFGQTPYEIAHILGYKKIMRLLNKVDSDELKQVSNKNEQ